MRLLRVWCLMGLVVVMSQTLAEEPLAVCGKTGETMNDGCWQPLVENPNCHVWDSNLETLGTATFQGRSRCRQGKLSGTGSLTWEWSEKGELKRQTVTGRLLKGKLEGEVVIGWPDGTREEGRFVDGKQQGIWVVTKAPGTEGWWDRSEGRVVDGKRQGDWKFIDYDSDGTLIAEHYGPFVDDAKQGKWVERTYFGEGSPWPGGSESAEGSYAKDKRHGQWTIEMSMVYGGEVYRHRREGAFAMGTRHGPWASVTYFVDLGDSGDSTVRDNWEGDAPRNHRRTEGSYSDGEPDGRWVIVHHHGEVDLYRDAAYASGESFIRLEGAYSKGKLEGIWRSVLSNGVVIVENFADGRRDGAYEARDSDGSLLIAANVSNGEVTELKLPRATLPPVSAVGSNSSAVVGAFGITFGPDIEQLMSLKCEPGSCFTNALEQLDGRLKDLDGSDGWIPGVQNVPEPISRGEYYDVFVSPWVGIAGLRAYLRFGSEEACREAKPRMVGLLRDQYAVCRDYRYMPESEHRTPIGQCEENGMPMVVISTACGKLGQTDSAEGFKVWGQLRLTYQVIEPSERDAMIDAWKKSVD